jgi:hypothetical protein
MKDFAEALTINGHPNAITAVIRVAPQYCTLQCLQDSLVHAEKQAKKLLERVCDALGVRNITTNQPQELTVESEGVWVYVFASAALRKGNGNANGLQTENNLRHWAGSDEEEEAQDPDGVTNEERVLGQMFLYGADEFYEGG